ncbi:NACHT domain-containing protein [Chitinophaga ginsengisoli]|nr:hypothetical protein [Chitinophaga ginsengisoli]
MSVLLYNPDRKDKQEFISEFVIRTEIFEEIFKDIKSGKMTTPEQHYLLLGQRGAGKTTLLLRLKYAIEDDQKLSKWLIPVIFSEEQYNISELGNLWEKIAEYLEDYHAFAGITEEMAPFIQHDNYEESLFRILIKHLDLHKKKIVLLIDNIGQLLARFGELEVRRLREILQTIPHLRLIAGSPVVLESVLDYQQPLFEFFKMIQLKGLTDEECIALLRQLAVVHHEEEKIERIIKNTPERISTLRTLSGGVPRTMSLLFQIFVDNEHGSALSDLEKVLDAVTPLYKHRMDDLPPQQQKIVDAVALHWEAISVKDLTKQVRLDSKLVSAQLRQLEKNQVIEKRATNTKNHIYLLRERFFNIWYLMRYGRKQDRNRVIWLVKFLESWCDKNEIEKRILDYVDKVKNGLLDKHTLEVYGEVYSFFQNIDIQTKYLLNENISEYIKTSTELSDDDFYKLLDKKLLEKDYSSFFKIAFERNVSEPASRERAFLYLKKSVPKFEPELLFNKKADLIRYLDNNSMSFHTLFCFALSEQTLMTSIFLQKADSVAAIINDLVLFFQYIKFTEVTDEEMLFFRQIIYFLLSGGYYQLAIKVSKAIPIADQDVEIWNKVITYMASNNSKEILSTLGSEIEEVMHSIVNSIIRFRKAIKVRYPEFQLSTLE